LGANFSTYDWLLRTKNSVKVGNPFTFAGVFKKLIKTGFVQQAPGNVAQSQPMHNGYIN
jgi:hypothetical protein